MRKTKDDLVMGQASYERWFASGKEADEAMIRLLRVLADGGDDVKELLLRVKLPEVVE